MSVDVDWSALSGKSEGGPDLVATLLEKLNHLLATTSRPSFIGPVSLTQFNVGATGPQLDLVDISDLWRAFEEADEEGDRAFADSVNVDLNYQRDSRRENARSDGQPREPSVSTQQLRRAAREGADTWHHDEDSSVCRSSLVGIPLTHGGGLAIGSSLINYSTQLPAMFAHPINNARRITSFGDRSPLLVYDSDYSNGRPPDRSRRLNAPQTPLLDTSGRNPFEDPPPSPPAGPPPGLPSRNSNSIPSVQLHLRYSHSSDLQLTVLTSLQVNYPSSVFMVLPLKFTVTGFDLFADLVVAYSGSKHRIHLSIVDDMETRKGEAPWAPGPGFGGTEGSASIAVGQRLLPNLHLESEIGHSDAHILRNVGKVERFIADVIRKTLVDQFVYPNFHSIAL